jgi:hypothetical protein
MTELTLALMLLFSPATPPRHLACSIHTTRDSNAAGLLAQVNVPYADALKAAQGSAPAPQSMLGDGFLEIQQGCLVYAFDVRSADKTGEIWVDAGTGRVLARLPEHPLKTAAEPAMTRGPPRQSQ